MNEATAPYRKWIYIGLLVQLIAAWFSVGYYHPDEHYQVLEFCNYRLGLSPLADLPWEYAAHCRGALQPCIVLFIAKVLQWMGAYNPFTVALLLRLLMAVLTWYTISRLIKVLLPEFTTEKGRKLFVYASFLLWFVPYIGVRFSAETIAADLFFIAITILLQVKNESGKTLQLLLAGLLLGFALFFRLQIGFAFIGLAIWLLGVQRTRFSHLLLLVVGGTAAIAVSVLVDRWFYGLWVFTPYNYFNVNIIQHVAAKFGVDPWWYYFVLFFNMGIPPLSLVLLALFIWGIIKRPGHVLSLVCITFIVGHFLIGHKEMRFLFPAMSAFIFVASLGLDRFFQHVSQGGIYKWTLRVLIVMNIVLLVFKIFTPAEELMKYYGFIYNYAQRQPTTIVAFNQSPYKLDVIECNFYKPSNLEIKTLQTPQQLQTLLAANTGRTIIYLSRTLKPGAELAGFKTEQLYCEYPGWLLQFNVNNWEDRSYIWAVYKLSL